MNREEYNLYLTAINSLIKDFDTYSFKKILLSRSNKKPETLIKFIKEKDNHTQLRMSFEHLLHSLSNSKHIETSILKNYVNEIIREIIFTDNQSFLGRLIPDDCELLFVIILYSFLFDIYQDIENSSYNFSEIYFTGRSFEEHIVQVEDLLNGNNGIFYRGQTIDCSMSPSMLRNLNKNISIDFCTYEYLIGDKNEKYNNHIKASGGIYEKMAFFQHSTNYSPLLDFTTKKIIAGSFALSNSNNINQFENNDSIIYGIQRIRSDGMNNVINSSEQANAFFKNEFYIDLIDSESITLFKAYSLPSYSKDNVTGKVIRKKKNITFTKFSDLYNYLKPSFKFIDVKTNDRMKYQEGLFLVFYGCVSLKGRVFYEFNPYFNLYKSIIYKSNKREILDDIYKKYREYDLGHLMDPYMFLSE